MKTKKIDTFPLNGVEKHVIWVSHGAIAQLVERYDGIVEASGSTPLGSTILLSSIQTDVCMRNVP